MSGAFFHKGITRFQAELYLTNSKDNGSFLVRDSESLAGAYVLCLLLNSEVHQYRILPGPDGKLHVQSESGTIQRGYNDLTELIADYIKKKENNGLACGLVHPVAPEGSNDDGELTDDDDEDDDEEDDDDDFEHPPPVQGPPATPTDKKKNNEAERIDLQRNFNKLDLTRCDSVFKKALKDYVDIGSQKDSTALNAGDSELQEFEKLLDSTASGLRRELDTYMRNIEVLHELLKVENRKNSTLDHRHRPCGPGLPNLLEQMSRVRSKILSLQTEAQETIQLASIPSDYEYLDYTDPMYAGNGLTSGPFLMSKYRPYIPQSKFEVKKIKSNRPTKLTLTVDLQNGKYSVLKQTGKESLSHNTISHDRILHLIKSTKDKCNLDVVLDGKNKQTYAFQDPHMRENFCLQIRQMKNMHSTETDIDQISLFIGTWNMGDASLNQSLSTWLKCTGSGTSRDRVLGVIPHDVYVVGTQESSMTEKDWVNQLKAGLKACVLVDMELVEVSSLWGIRLAILCKPELKAFISRVQRSSVRTGIANTFGNKGAVAISFYFNGTSFCFINTHLTSGDERCNRRNQNYRDIIKGLTMSLGQKHLSLFDITNQFHHVFWLGDLNYRVEEEIQVLLRKINEKDINFLLERDQLKRLQKQRTVFSAFDEADITFLPTYRLERNVPGYKYAWKKIKATSERINAPSWCDRVLWKSYPGQFIESVAYGCSEAILSSDHRPVFSSFNVGISSEFVHHARLSLAEMAIVQIVFTSVEAQVKTCCKQYFQLVFHSTCLQEVYRSQSNTSFRENRTGFYTVPVWVATNLPEMRPLFGDLDYLEDQHILIAVVAKDSDNESYGECVLSLREMFSDEPKPFEYTLLHQGEETGKISGKMHLKTKGKKASSSRSGRNNYSLIALDTEYHDPEMYLPDHPTHKPPGAFRGSVKPGMGLGQSKPPLGSTMSSHNNTAPKPPLRPTVSSMDDKLGGPMTRETNQRSMRMEGRAPAPLPSSPTSLTPIPPARRGTPVMGQGSLRVAPPVRQRSAPGSAPQKHVPPIPPKQRTVSGPDHHYINRQDGHKRPKTLDEWLAQLNLSVYEKNFTDYGWDSLLYLGELKLEDLIRIGVEVPEHQRMILTSIRDLNKPLYENQVIWETDDVTHSDGEGYATHPKERRSCPETIRHNYVNEFKPLISVVPGKDNIAYSSENVGIEKPMKTSDTRKGDDVEIYKSAKYQVGYKERVTILAKGTSVKVAVGEYVMDGDVPVEEEDDVYHEPIFNDSQDDLPTADQFYHVLEKPDKINPRTSTLYNSASTCINMQAANDANRGPSPNTYDKIDLSGELREMDMSDIQNSSEMLTLDEWLGALGLEMYHDTLVENGWVNLMVLHEMTEADLDMLNIDNKGHRLKMLHAIQYLKGNNSTSDKTVVI